MSVTIESPTNHFQLAQLCQMVLLYNWAARKFLPEPYDQRHECALYRSLGEACNKIPVKPARHIPVDERTLVQLSMGPLEH